MTEMAHQPRDKRKTAKRRRRLTLLAVAMVLLAVVVVYVWSRSGSTSVEERLAALEAARTIPDSENAAAIYDDLLKDPNAASLSDHLQEFLDDETWYQMSTRPWLSAEHPQFAAWITNHQYIIDKLLEAGRFDKCRFPVVSSTEEMGPQMERVASMRQWAFLLRFAGNNDLAEGRVDAAITKWRCIVQMGNHLRQQPTIIDQLCADAVGRLAWAAIARFIVEGIPTEMCFQNILATPLPKANELERNLKDIRSVKDVPAQRLTENFGPVERLQFRIFKWRLGGMPSGPDLDDVRRMYQRHTATTRGIRILIPLRRYKDQFGDWPDGLDAIRSEVAQEILVDPFSKGDFVYRQTADSFTLYSKGKNNIDEGGRCLSDSREGPDDWPIWPPKDHGTRVGTTNRE